MATTRGAITLGQVAASLSRRGGMGRSMASVGGATAVAQLIGLAVLPLVSRHLAPEAFGRFGLFFTLATILGATGALGLPEAVIAARSRADAVAVMAATLRAILLVGLLCSGITWALMRLGAFGLSVLPAWSSAAMAPVVWLMSLMVLLQMWMVRRRRFERLASAYVAQGAVRGGLQVILSLALPALGWLVLLSSEMVGRLATVLVMAGPARAELALALRMRSARWMSVVRRYWRFPAFRTPSMLANNLGSGLPLFLIASIAPPREVGAFTFMMTIIVGPIGFMQRAVGDVFLGEFAARYRTDPGRARALLLWTAGGLALAAVPASVVLALFAPPLFAMVFGPVWREAGVLAAAFAPAFLANLVVAPIGGVVNVTNRPGFKLLVDLTGIAAILLAFGIGRVLGLRAVDQTRAFAVASVCAYGLYFLLILRAVGQPGRSPSVQSRHKPQSEAPSPR